jgi:hypothetical protein
MNSKSKNSASRHVVFLDGLEIRHGLALTQRGGVWRVDCGREIVNVWEDDIFADVCQAQKALNLILN